MGFFAAAVGALGFLPSTTAHAIDGWTTLGGNSGTALALICKQYTPGTAFGDLYLIKIAVLSAPGDNYAHMTMYGWRGGATSTGANQVTGQNGTGADTSFYISEDLADDVYGYWRVKENGVWTSYTPNYIIHPNQIANCA